MILGVRNIDAGKGVADEIKRRVPSAKVEVGPSLDLLSQDSVRKFAEAINKRSGPLNILVNNAGLGYMKRGFTEQGVGVLTQASSALNIETWCIRRALQSPPALSCPVPKSKSSKACMHLGPELSFTPCCV